MQKNQTVTLGNVDVTRKQLEEKLAELTLIEKLTQRPETPINFKIELAIRMCLKLPNLPGKWIEWANGWLSGKDCSRKAAAAAAAAAYAYAAAAAAADAADAAAADAAYAAAAAADAADAAAYWVKLSITRCTQLAIKVEDI